MCPDCNHAVSEHVDQGCSTEGGCQCGHDYTEAAGRAREEGTQDVSYVRERGYDTESTCQNCGKPFGECDCTREGES